MRHAFTAIDPDFRREPRHEFGNSGVDLRHREDWLAPTLSNISLTQICFTR
jgi:hypothetical protein